MKSTSLRSRLVRSAARSPARSSTGPDVWRRLTPSSCAMICESVVLPSPGGPNKSTWSSDSLRFFAASMKIENWQRIFSWPMYSSSARGRSVRSSTSSCGFTGAAATRRSASIIGLLCLRQQLQRLPDAVGERNAVGKLLDRVHGFLVAVAQRDQCVQYVGRDRRRTMNADRGGEIGAELVLELQQEAFGGFFANARDLGETARLLHRDRLRELGDRQAGQHRERDARADAADLDQLPECAPLVFRSESEEKVRVLAHHKVREQDDVIADIRQVVERAHRHVDFVRNAFDVEQNLRRILLDQRPGKPAYHRILPRRTR